MLAKPIQKESGGKKWVCFHIGTLYMSGSGAATAKRHVPTLLHLSPSVSLEYIYAICQSASTSVPQFHSVQHSFSQLHFPYMVNRENFAAATTIHVFTHYDEKYAGGAICVGGVVSPQNKHTCASHSLGYHN